ncbi:target of rapamycin (TOR) kinase 1 [Trypanosoma cruzi]|nr:target of rapamycin (TOR) kinase 1 [Trypanosoma cruzi]
MAEAASCLGSKASFSTLFTAGDSAPLLILRGGWRAGGAGAAPMGHKAGPEIRQIVIRQLPRRRRWFSASGAHLRWCVSTFGSTICASQGRKATRHRGRPKRFVTRTAVTPRRGRTANRAPRSTPSWGRGSITLRTVSLSDEFARSVRAMPALNSLTIAEMEVWRHAFCTWRPFCARFYVTATFSSRQCDDDCPHVTGDGGEDIPGEPSAGSGWLGREIATHHRE